MGAKTKAERLAEGVERNRWLALEIAADELRAAIKARDRNKVSLTHEAMEPLVAELRGPDGSEGQAGDGE